MDLKGVFNSEPRSLFDTVSESGVCFYLPAYQRPYAWSKKNVERVFEDVLHGIENNLRNEDAITFIGTILAIHDTKYQTIKPFKRGEVPAKVMLIIDGQQRLTTMLLIMMALHEGIRLREKKVEKEIDKLSKELEKTPDNTEIQKLLDAKVWLLDKINQESANLRYFSTDTNSNRSKIFRWYPKIIRAYQDCWSKTEDGAEYNSPIAAILHAYNTHILDNEDVSDLKPFKYDINKNKENFDKHDVLQKNLALIKKKVERIAKNSDEEDALDLKQLMGSCFKDAFLFDIPTPLLEKETSQTHEQEALNLIVFSKYFLNRVCVTYVTVTNEAYAFDMFEALNTTGEPLTSIETFKPKVIEEEGLGSYENSPSKKYMDMVDEVLEKISDPGAKHRQTDRIMLAFALSESGEKISKHISDQRRYLITSYSNANNNISEKRKYVCNLAHVTKFINEEWDQKHSLAINDPNDEHNLPLLCLDFLRKAGHEISIPLIQRFYSEYKNNIESEKAKQDLIAAVKACAAFFALWRAAHRNTAGIDSVYRDILKNGSPAANLKPVARGFHNTLDIEAVKAGLLASLTSKIQTLRSGDLRDSWIQITSGSAIYDTIEVCRFVLLCAFHDRWPDANDNTKLKSAAKGAVPMLSWHKWKLFSDESGSQSEKYTIEHVGPQKFTSEWHNSLDDSTVLNSIGNLTILPSAVNASAGNSSWIKKKEIYQALCTKVREEADQNNNNLLSQNQKILIERTPYMGFLEPLTRSESWDAQIVRARSENLLEGAFDLLIQWLKPSGA